MTEDNGSVRLQRRSAEEIEATVEGIKRMLRVGVVFAGIGYLLVGSAIVFELTEFHPLLDDFFRTYTETSLAGGSGGPRGGTVNEALASIHKWPSTLLWLILVAISS